VDDRTKRQTPRAGLDRATERDRASVPQLSKRLVTRPTFDGTRNSLRQQQPPRDDVSVPGVDDDIHILIKQVSINNSKLHADSVA
jgi:hypothetical protein